MCSQNTGREVWPSACVALERRNVSQCLNTGSQPDIELQRLGGGGGGEGGGLSVGEVAGDRGVRCLLLCGI